MLRCSDCGAWLHRENGPHVCRAAETPRAGVVKTVPVRLEGHALQVIEQACYRTQTPAEQFLREAAVRRAEGVLDPCRECLDALAERIAGKIADGLERIGQEAERSALCGTVG